MRIIVFSLLALSVRDSTSARGEVSRECSQGNLKGVVQRTISGRDVAAFLGIPYARPPIGDLRFKDPVPAEPWIGTLIATKPPNQCLQINQSQTDGVSGSEDCLYLNVYVPNNAISRKANHELMDVMVYIHGGGFEFGSANNHGPSYLLDQEDVVLVIMNYRLGILGFLSLLDEHLPGNFGLKDQVMVLKWVKKNIAYFGGDPNKVTLVGCSAGAASVHAHLLSPLSRGLFHKSIITSGAAFNPWMFKQHPQQKTLKISEALGCPTDDHKVMVECLRQRPAERVAAMSHMYTGKMELDVGQFVPVIEPPSKTAFIDSEPEEVIRSGRAMDIPILLAYMEDDAIFATAQILANATLVKELEENWTVQLTHMKHFSLEGKAKRCVAEAIRKFYLGEDSILENPAKFTQIYSDWGFKVGIEKAAKLHAAYNKKPVYAYVFSYVSNKRYSDYYNTSGIYKGGACHGDDLYYVLETSYLVKRPGGPEDDAMSRTMIDLWMKFIRSAVPEEWKPVASGLPNFTYWNITGPDFREHELRIKNDESVAEFWKSMETFHNNQEPQQEEL